MCQPGVNQMGLRLRHEYDGIFGINVQDVTRASTIWQIIVDLNTGRFDILHLFGTWYNH